jgi:hypothetical protein
MSRKRQGKREWTVHQKFEPNRLSQASLEQAYAKIVPQHVRVLRIPISQLEEPQEVYQLARARSVR